MTVVELLRSHIERLHQDLEAATSDLTPEQLHWRPSENCNHIAFSLWHYVRTEDNLVRFVLQDRRTTVWLEEGWNERFGLERAIQGTGMSAEDAAGGPHPVHRGVPPIRAGCLEVHRGVPGLYNRLRPGEDIHGQANG